MCTPCTPGASGEQDGQLPYGQHSREIGSIDSKHHRRTVSRDERRLTDDPRGEESVQKAMSWPTWPT